MTKNKLKALLPVMQAWVDGQQVQYKICTGEWENISNPSWNIGSEYRIAPVKKKLIRYINIYGDYSSNTHVSREAADNWASNARIACVRIEYEYEEGQFDE